MIPVNYAQVTLHFQGAAVPNGADVVFGVQNAAGGMTAAQIATFVDGDVVSAGLLGRFSTSLELSNIHVKLGPDISGPFTDKGVSRSGGSAGDANPVSALLVTKETASGGRKNRGRSFYPGLIEADVAQGGVLTSTALTAFQTIMTAWLDALTADGIPMVILHDDGGVTAPTVVTNYSVQALTGIQKRRLRP